MPHRAKRIEQPKKKRHPLSNVLYGWQWSKASRRFLADHPLCVDCLDRSITTIATLVHHEPHHCFVPSRFWDANTWVALCDKCHGRRHSKDGVAS